MYISRVILQYKCEHWLCVLIKFSSNWYVLENKYNENPFPYEHAVNQHYNSLISVGHIHVQY